MVENPIEVVRTVEITIEESVLLEVFEDIHSDEPIEVYQQTEGYVDMVERVVVDRTVQQLIVCD